MPGIVQPSYLPVFGSGAPGGAVSHDATYYDTATTPYTSYVYHAGAWHATGTSSGGGNATSIQGTPVSAATPANGQVLELVGTTWTPTTPSGGPIPTIVQEASTAGNIGPVTLGVAPTQNNLLFAITCDNGVSENPSSGWTKLFFASAVNDGVGFLYKIAGASEGTTQTPTTSTAPGSVTVFEIANATPSWLYAENKDLSGSAIAATVQASLAQLVIGVACNRSTTGPTSITGATLLGAGVSGGSRFAQPFKVTAPIIGTNTITANYATSQGAAIPMIEIG